MSETPLRYFSVDAIAQRPGSPETRRCTHRVNGRMPTGIDPNLSAAYAIAMATGSGRDTQEIRVRLFQNQSPFVLALNFMLPPTQDQLFTVDEVAALLKLSRWSVIRKFEDEPASWTWAVPILPGAHAAIGVLRIPSSVTTEFWHGEGNDQQESNRRPLARQARRRLSPEGGTYKKDA